MNIKLLSKFAVAGLMVVGLATTAAAANKPNVVITRL